MLLENNPTPGLTTETSRGQKSKAIACFPALYNCYRFSSALNRSEVTCVASVPAILGARKHHTFSRALNRSHVLPRFTPVTCFPTLYTSNMCSRAFHQFDVFPALCTCYMFSRDFYKLYALASWFG